jgi:CrcB protein
MTPLLVVLGAAVGAALRFTVASRLDKPSGLPWGTLVVNVAGSALLGALSAMALSGHAIALLGTGFCGGFTTYSAFAVQTHGLGPRRGTAYAAITIGVSLAACALGFWIAA